MNRSEKFNFYLPQNVDPIDVSNFDYNFEIIDENLITEEQELTSTQKANARANLDLGDAALKAVANNLTTSSAGSVLDARQGKALGDRTTKNESAVSAIRNSMAIVSAGNTHSAITAGQYVYVHSHSSLNEGLYTANSNISANATLSTSNLTAVSGGGLNALNSKIASLQMHYLRHDYTITANGATNTNLYTLIENAKPTGATVLGVVGYSTNDVNVIPISFKYDNGNYSLQLKNLSASAISNHADIYYLCIV